MKRILACILALAMLLAASALAESEAPTLEQLSGLQWSFSSGAGGWSTELTIAEDGSFTGNYHDSEMGDIGDDYPNGSLYGCSFSGQLTLGEAIDDNAWNVHVDSLTVDGTLNEESIEDGIRYITVEPYGIKAGDDMALYLPGTPAEAISEEMQFWAHLNFQDDPTALESWFLANEASESGFVGYEAEPLDMVNPWVTMTADEIAQVAGLSFNVPEGAENVIYAYMADDQLAEMQFTLDGDEYTARFKPDALEAGQIDNISGMYFEWEHEEEVTIHHCTGTLGIAQTGSEDWVENCLWYDIVPGIMYSLSVYTTDPDGLDLTAVAEMVFPPAQGDA